MQFILKEQEPDGSWFGRWGVNYLYGTFLVLRGLEAIGYDQNEPPVQQSVEWVRWCRTATAAGARPAAPMTIRQRGVGPSTPSQTAWALLAAGGRRHAI